MTEPVCTCCDATPHWYALLLALRERAQAGESAQSIAADVALEVWEVEALLALMAEQEGCS